MNNADPNPAAPDLSAEQLAEKWLYENYKWDMHGRGYISLATGDLTSFCEVMAAYARAALSRGPRCETCSAPIDAQVDFLNREIGNFRRNAQFAELQGWKAGMEEALKIFGDSITWSEASRAIPERIVARAGSLPQPLGQQWIPVSEQTPESCKPVLIAVPFFDCKSGEFTEWVFTEAEYDEVMELFRPTGDDCSDDFDKAAVQAWTELPELTLKHAVPLPHPEQPK